MGAAHALFPGTFDPVTCGHLDILERALALFDQVTVAVAAGSKADFLNQAERVSLFAAAAEKLPGCRVVPFSGLLVDELRRQGVKVVVRGIRSPSDYEHEWSMAGVNRSLLPGCEYVFLLARPEFAAISSSLVREVARYGGDISGLVPPAVATAINRLRPGENP